jgi:hypothetical protein
VVPVAPASCAVLDVTVEARRTPAQLASVRADRPVEPGEFGCRFAWLRKKTAGLRGIRGWLRARRRLADRPQSVDAGQDLAASDEAGSGVAE